MFYPEINPKSIGDLPSLKTFSAKTIINELDSFSEKIQKKVPLELIEYLGDFQNPLNEPKILEREISAVFPDYSPLFDGQKTSVSQDAIFDLINLKLFDLNNENKKIDPSPSINDFRTKILSLELIKAVRNKHLDLVKELLDEPSVNVNEEDEYGRTALSFAIANDDFETFELLLTKISPPYLDFSVHLDDAVSDPSINSKFKKSSIGPESVISPLNFAISKNNIKMIETLLSKEGTIDTKSLSYPVMNNNIQTLKYLIEYLQENIEIDVLKDIIKDTITYDLHEISNYLKSILLNKYSEEIDFDNFEGLDSSIVNASLDRASFLLKSKKIDLTIAGNSYTLFSSAIVTQNIDAVQLLLVNKADINSQDTNLGASALMVATTLGYKEIVELLLKYNPNVDLQTTDGCTALIFAALKDHKEILELLLKHSANFNIRDNDNYSAIDHEAHNIIRTISEKPEKIKEFAQMLLNNKNIDPKISEFYKKVFQKLPLKYRIQLYIKSWF